LLNLTRRTLAHAQQVETQLRTRTQPQAVQLAESLARYVPLVQQVIEQTARRVFQKVQVAAAQKVVSLFEPHSAVIRRGRPTPRETEFGRKVWFSEVEGGILSDYRLLQGNPPDEQRWATSVQQHAKLFAHPPEVATADRGVFSPANEQLAHEHHIAHVALPQRGYKSVARAQYEDQRWFKAALKFRAGIEGRISALKRARGLERCLNHGENGMLRWIGWGVITNNLIVIATKLARRHHTRPLSAGSSS
jgi:IS5 family transposase